MLNRNECDSAASEARPLLSVIIPCLNEEANVGQVLELTTETLSNSDIRFEIIVVDDQSTDGTLRIAEAWAAKNPHFNIRVIYKQLHRRGYGAAVKYGLAYASGEYATFVSADIVDPINLLPDMYHALQDRNDVVQISRYIDANDALTIPFLYKFWQFFYRVGVRLALSQRVPDSTYAFKMFDRAKIQALGLSSNRFSISPEILFKAYLASYRIVFIPGSQGVRTSGVSKFHFRKEGPGFAICLLRAWMHRKSLLFWF